MASSTSWLDKFKRNELFVSIRAAELDPREFELQDDEAKIRIKHKWSESCFVISGDPSHYVGSRVVGDAADSPFDVYSWRGVIERFGYWLKEVQHDLATPDLWAELQRETELLRTYSDGVIENTPFTPDEQNEIASQLRAFADRTKRSQLLSTAQMHVLEAKIDYLIKAAGRIGKFDWLNVLAAVLGGYALAAVLPPEVVHAIIPPLLRAIGHIFGVPELPGPSGPVE